MEFIKKHFLPHEDNHYRPHFLRLPLALVAAVTLLAVQFVPPPEMDVLGEATSIEKREIINLTNAQRAKAGLSPLQENAKLSQAAKAKAKDMFKKGYWAHYSPDGTAPWQFIEDSGYYYQKAGENLAKNFDTSSGVMAGWMNSQGHRENILNKKYNEVGVAVLEGNLNGEPTTLTVAMYGAPQPAGVALPGPEKGQTLPAKTSYSLSKPLNPIDTSSAFIWAVTAAFILLALLYLSQHLVFQKKRLAWVHAPHKHPLLQAGVFGALVVVLLQSGFGAVG